MSFYLQQLARSSVPQHQYGYRVTFLQLIHTNVPDFIRIEPCTQLSSLEISQIVKAEMRTDPRPPAGIQYWVSLGFNGPVHHQAPVTADGLAAFGSPRECAVLLASSALSCPLCPCNTAASVKEGKGPPLINRQCMFLNASLVLMFHIF